MGGVSFGVGSSSAKVKETEPEPSTRRCILPHRHGAGFVQIKEDFDAVRGGAGDELAQVFQARLVLSAESQVPREGSEFIKDGLEPLINQKDEFDAGALKQHIYSEHIFYHQQ